MASWRIGCKEFWELRPVWLVPIAVLVFLPVFLPSGSSEGRCAYVLLVMAVLWLTETIPIAATALLPVFLLPMVGVQPARDVASNYITDTSMLFIGGLMVAVAVEEWNLHKRIALAVLRVVGTNPLWLMLGLMLPTWFLSMWISNTATTSMMIPILNAVMQQLQPNAEGAAPGQLEGEEDMQMAEVKGDKGGKDGLMVSVVGGTSDRSPGEPSSHKYRVSQAGQEETRRQETGRQETGQEETRQQEAGRQETGQEETGQTRGAQAEFQRLARGLCLSIAYASNVGGIATLTGTPPNLVLQGQANQLYSKYGLEAPVSFSGWMVLALPLSALTLVLGWLWLVILFVRGRCLRRDKMAATRVKKAIAQQFRDLGPLSMAEIILILLFLLLAAAWLSRDPKMADGWSVWFKSGHVSDSTPAILVAVLLFLLPGRPPRALCCRAGRDTAAAYTPLLTWDMVHRRLPWGVIVLLGGGFALADACKVSGLSNWVGGGLASLQGMEPWLLNLILCCIVALATEFTSNTATASLILPILAELAIQIGFNPLYLMASGAIATSFAFVMPVATPPNAIVFSTGLLRIPDMAMAGVVMNVVAVLCLTLAVNTWGDAFFNFHHLDPAFLNSTATATA